MLKSLRLSLAVIAVASAVAACQNPATPVLNSTGTPVTAAQQALGAAEDTEIIAQTAYIGYLDANPDPKVVARIQPLYLASRAALASYRASVIAGTAPGSQPVGLVAALAAFNAGLLSAGIITQTGV